ncbi:hypothetical protein PYW07_000596 [Mythimna separata]|uniref:PHR domain-containing protein n=1 Tax=Mythimna separata TaxID=271217 RepID=A0AAD7Z445_MYTSE|nr:hypothetical protein PYW07_000596 [Mythimna separata]
MQVPELRCMEPENYKKYFRALCWSGTKKERRSHKRIGKKEKLRRLKATSALAVCYAPALLGNPSQFAVYASVRKSILARWRHLHGSAEMSDDSDCEDSSPVPLSKLPKITGIGLKSVFSLISQARSTNAQFCEMALSALLDVLQGHAPEELAQEPTDIILNLHTMLVEVASGSGPGGTMEHPSNLTALSSSCLIALSVARGEAELILNAVASLTMSPAALYDQDLQIPSNLITLQRSVQSVILGSPSRNLWLTYGVPHQCLVNSFPVDLPPQLTGAGELVVRSLVSDGCFLYVFTSKGLLKIGSGYGSSIRQHVYLHKPDFFASDRHGWLGYCKNKLYLRIGRKKTEVYEIDRETLEVRNMIRLEPGQPAPVEPKSAVFTDGNQLGLILLTNFDNLTIRMYDADAQPERNEGSATTTLTSQKEINVHLLRRRTLVLGRSPFEDGVSRRTVELDAPIAMQLDDCDEDPLMSICGGQDFALLTTASGKVYYTGKGASLGYKAASPQTGRWTLMKETIFSRNEAPNVKRCKVIQVAVGHEGVHAILVLDNGTALFTGIARRGEDGDAMKHRRQPKPTRPKKIFKAEGHFVVYAACNYGSSALVTRQGHLLMFGKDTQHCDSAGQVLGLRNERIVQVALGKAHAVALTNFGQVYTFGINNKGQCGREFGYTKEKIYPPRRRSESKEESRLCTTSHTWTTDYCRVCVLCRDCTGFSSACHCSHLPNRVAGDTSHTWTTDYCRVCVLCRDCTGFSSACHCSHLPNRVAGDTSHTWTTDYCRVCVLCRDCTGFSSACHCSHLPNRVAGDTSHTWTTDYCRVCVLCRDCTGFSSACHCSHLPNRVAGDTSHTWTTDYCRVCVLCRDCTGFSSACHCSHLPNRVAGDTSHTWTTDYCRVCVLCRDCTGFSSACHCSHLPNRVAGELLPRVRAVPRLHGLLQRVPLLASAQQSGRRVSTLLPTTSHTWTTDYCRVCVLCRDCTGFSSACHCSHLPNRVAGEKCGCGEGDSGCAVCGVCRRCADAFVVAARPERPSIVTVTDLDDDGEASARPDSRIDVDDDGDAPAKVDPSGLDNAAGGASARIERKSDLDNACGGATARVDRKSDLDDIAEVFAILDSRSEKENVRFTVYESQAASSEVDRDASIKVSCLPPARVAVPGGHRIAAIACGLHHTVLITEHGEVLTFGSNQYGQLGAGDISVHHRIVRVRVPKASSIAAGSNHTAVLTREGELYTFGSYQKGALGRPRMEEPLRTDRSPIWYATPGRVPRLGPRHSCKAVWVSASGDQTFVQVSQALIKTDTLFSSTITSNSNTIIILPNRSEHTFKCITINKMDGSCNTWTGSEQVDFVNSLACLDPLYDVLWCYQPQMRVMKCYNILAFDSHKLQKCCNDPESYFGEGDFEYPNYGSMKRLEDFKNLENFDLSCRDEDRPTDNVALSNMSVLNQELAIPSTPGCSVTRMHAALHLLGCLDSLTYAHDIRLNSQDSKRDTLGSPILPVKEDYLTVNRFDSNGGGWGYSGHSVEAIRFMCDTDILLGGIGLYGGRGDYTAKVKVYDIGTEGGDQEGDGELITESDEIVYECPPRDRFPVMFDNPVPLAANRWYVAWACISGPSSDCGSSGQAMVINDEIGFHFKTSKKSNNGTDVNAGQIPCFIYNTVSPDHTLPLKIVDFGEPIIVLSKNFSRKVTVSCFKSLITLLQWSWDAFKEIILETNGLVPINYQKLTVMKHQKRLVYVIRACLRLVRSYINEIYPQNNRKRNSHEYMSYFEAIAEVRNLIQAIMADQTPTCSMLPRKPGKSKAHRVCYVQFALELTTSILKEAHDTITACFHAFFPTPTLKWNHLCSMLYHVKEGVVPPSQIRELTSTCAAMCASRSLRDVLQYVVPVTQSYINANENRRPDSKVLKEVPSKSATVPRSSHAQKPPPIPPRANNRDTPKQPDTAESRPNHTEWHLLDVLPRMLDIVMIPIKQQMMTRQCGQPHDHGEIKQYERLSEFCCKLTARIVAELSTSATSIREDTDSNTVKNLVTPSRFMRVNQSRAWNTGNGSPDAICFTVDRSGITLVGVSVYGGLGNYEYSLELLHDVRLRAAADEANPTHCWVSVEIAHGNFTAADLQHDTVQLKFERPVPLKEDLRYAIRLCNHGGRTSNGDCGLPSVKGPDGTTFRFASCSLSFNGTTLARGQIPSLVYYGSSKTLSNSSESADSLLCSLRSITLRVASIVMERGAELFCTLRNELTAEDLRRNATVLQTSPAINILIPYTLANLDGVDDPKSVIKILEMIHKLLPHVAAMNLLVPNLEECTTTTGHYYTWLESDHPYKQATVTNMRVLFPTSVSWVVLEMDPRSITAQPEDSLTLYAVAGTPKHRCHCANEVRVSDPPFRKRLVQLTNEGDVEELGDEPDSDGVCMHYNCTYVSVTPRLANNVSDWPQKALLIPGNEVIFSLETASDYLTEFNKSNNEDNRFGFRCLCVGYEDTPLTTQRVGLVALEMELVYAGAACASKLLAPDIEIPPLTFSTLVEVQVNAMMGGSPVGVEGDPPHDGSEALLLSRGLELSSPPSIHHVLDGQPLLR